MVLEYFDNYFGDNLNEDTSNEEIMEAVEELIELCNVVCEAVGLQELKTSTLQRYVKKAVGDVDSSATHIGKLRGKYGEQGGKKRISKSEDEAGMKAADKLDRRRKGIRKAVDRLATRKTRMYQGGERGSEIK